MEIDHIFICVDSNAPEAEILKEFGLIEGSSNRHQGQGTANRRFFFHNIFLELLWLENVEEAQSDLTKPTQLYERFTQKNFVISPFGFCFRPSEQRNNVPFNTWTYQPSYLPAPLSVLVAQNNSLSEPMWFYLDFAIRPDQLAKERRQPLQHLKPLKCLTSVRIQVPRQSLSSFSTWIKTVKEISVVEGEAHLLEMTFDEGKNSCIHDFRPHLPLIFQW